jgi:hypothetical protein
MSEDKPHLVLQWVHNADTQELKCTIDENLSYLAHRGGHEGYTKIYNGNETFVSAAHWEVTEKFWISEQHGEELGYFQPDDDRQGIEPKNGRLEGRKNGFGRNGEYLDHMARSQLQLNGGDMAFIIDEHIGFRFPDAHNPAPLFHTPDKGLTIYKTLPTANSFYNGRHNKDHVEEDGTWQMVPQPCMMQPFSRGRILSSYEEMEIADVPATIIDKCKAGEWEDAPYPEIQDNYVYSTINTAPITSENVNAVWDE